MDYLYSKLNKQVETATYQGRTTGTAEVVVNNVGYVISVNVLDIPQNYVTLITKLSDDLHIEVERASGVEESLARNLNAEISRAHEAETQLQTNLNTEILRAYTYLQQKPTIVQDLVSTSITTTIQPASEYYYGELTSITFTFANGSLGDLFYITFSSGATPTDIIFDNVSNAVWDTDFTAEADKTVEICGKWDGSKWLILMTQL